MSIIDYVILLLSCVVEIYLFYTFFEMFFAKRIWFIDNSCRIRCFNIFVIIILFFCNLLGNRDINLFLFPTVTWLYTWVLFRGKFGGRVLYFIIAFSIIWGSEWIYVIILDVGNNAYKNKSQMPFMVLSLKLLTYILFIIVEQLIGNNKKKIDNKLFANYICLPIANFGMMIGVIYYDIEFSSDVKIKVLMTICYALTLFGNIIIFYAFNKYAEELNSNLEAPILIVKQRADLNYYVQRVEIQENHNEFVHNISHFLRAISQLAMINDCDSIIKMVGELDNQVEQHEIIWYSNNHILNVILSERQQQAEDENILFDIFIEPGVVLTMVEDVDLIAMFGNLLDNAFRATCECLGEKFIQLKVYMQEVEGFCVVKIVNSFSGNIIKVEDKFVSTKKEKGKHGLGINNVNKIAEKYGGYLSCKVKENVFETILLLSTNDK